MHATRISLLKQIWQEESGKSFMANKFAYDRLLRLTVQPAVISWSHQLSGPRVDAGLHVYQVCQRCGGRDVSLKQSIVCSCEVGS